MSRPDYMRADLARAAEAERTAGHPGGLGPSLDHVIVCGPVMRRVHPGLPAGTVRVPRTEDTERDAAAIFAALREWRCSAGTGTTPDGMQA